MPRQPHRLTLDHQLPVLIDRLGPHLPVLGEALRPRLAVQVPELALEALEFFDQLLQLPARPAQRAGLFALELDLDRHQRAGIEALRHPFSLPSSASAT